VICMSLINVMLVAGDEPKETPVTPVKPLPVMTTVVPPVLGPLVGLMPVTSGTGKAVRPGVGVAVGKAVRPGVGVGGGVGKGARPGVGVGKGARPGVGVGKGARPGVGVGKGFRPGVGAVDVGVGEGIVVGDEIGDSADDPDEFVLPQDTNIMQLTMMIMSKIVTLNHLSDTLYLLNEAYNMCSSIQINQSEYLLNNKAYLISNQFKLILYSL
jgi:hypothetical protein